MGMEESNKGNIFNQIEACKRVTSEGSVYWMARDLMRILGYARWENFISVIERARMACESASVESSHQFRETTKGIAAGKGAEIQRTDFFLSRYACYLICMNGDTSKPEIGFAQTYFAVQTRRQEVRDQIAAAQPRIEVRERIRDANKKLNSAAKHAGVQHYGTFHDAGYRGLYGGFGKSEIEELKKIPAKEDLLDCIGRAELAANEFRITQTEEKLLRENVQGETNAVNTHFRVGKAVRQTITELGGTMPEKLPQAPSIKRIAKKRKPPSDHQQLLA
jgi:DNA-damage-inducible protein D